tara:strand:- start:968 stop:1147 length:180 start_codon:yes stop_codon:yes gene_type:complete
MKKKKTQFAHYKQWRTDQGYTFLAENKKDAETYLEAFKHLGELEEVMESQTTVVSNAPY